MFISILSCFLLSLRSSQSFSTTSLHRGRQSSLEATKIVWFRDHALRINDNEALTTAIQDSSGNGSDATILPLYLWPATTSTHIGQNPIDPKTGGTAKDVFISSALQNLHSALGNSLIIGSVNVDIDVEDLDTTSGTGTGSLDTSTIKELIEVCRRSDAKEVYYLKSHRENKKDHIAEHLIQNGITPRPFGGSYSLIDYSKHDVPWKDIIYEHPWRSPLIPFVDYVKRVLEESMCSARGDSDSPRHNLNFKGDVPDGMHKQFNRFDDNGIDLIVPNRIDVGELVKTVGIVNGNTDWGNSITTTWPASEESAKEALDTFLESLGSKCEDGKVKTHLASRLSPYLARGVISPMKVYDAIKALGNDADTDSFVRRICWRDYTYAVGALYPDVTAGKAIRQGYEELDHGISCEGGDEEKEKRLRCWKEGKTGFPLIDAGMRQLISEGWMPQKVRLACSTALVEGLGISWRVGMQHFAEFLVDYDDSINSNMWMNAGCVGLDPYYVGMNYKRRMYWDNDGSYVRKWCPELSNLPDSVDVELDQTTKTVDCLYEPWASPPEILEEAGVSLGKTYPNKVCDDRVTRSTFFADVRTLRSQWPSAMTDDKQRDLISMGEAGAIGLFTPRAILKQD